MTDLPLEFEVLVFAVAVYGAILVATMLLNRRGRGSGGLDEPGPGSHVADEGWAQALVRQVLTGHGKGDRRELRIARPLREIVVQDRRAADQDIVGALVQQP